MWFIDKSLLSIKKKKGELLLNANNSMAWSLHILSAGLNWSSIWEMTKKRAVTMDLVIVIGMLPFNFNFSVKGVDEHQTSKCHKVLC